jgi:hypothetical protein
MTCLEDTYWFLYHREDKENFHIIHAIVERRHDRLRHPHAVIYNKKTGNIHEVSNRFKKKNVIYPFILWASVGNVSNIKQYTFEEINNLVVKTKMWDFYHLDLKDLNWSGEVINIIPEEYKKLREKIKN